MRAAKVFYITVLVAYLGSIIWSTRTLPDPAATSFGDGGRVTGWTSPASSAMFSLAVGLLIFGLVPALSVLATRAPQLINLPSARQKEYWTRPENLTEFRRRLTDHLLTMAGLTGLLLIVMEASIVAANRRTPPRTGPEMPWAVGIYLLATVVWVLMLIRGLSVPKDDGAPEAHLTCR